MLRCLPAALLVTLVAATPAAAKVEVSILGWTTQAGSTSPQVKDFGKVKSCLDTGIGQRSLRVIFRGSGISKSTKVGVAVWGGPASTGFAQEPSTAKVAKDGFRWPVSSGRTSIQPYGFSFAKGPFGPQQIDGVWRAKVVVKGKVVERGRVTIAC